MRLYDHLKPMSQEERADFALGVGTTIGHLHNVMYGGRTASAALTRQIASTTERKVAEWDLRPRDWHRIWPDLIGTPGAPDPTPAKQEARDAA